MKSSPIPVWLVTGYLGSGKTTLLRTWLKDPLLAGAALIVNEIGEIGFDDKMLSPSVDSTGTLMAGQCVCCSGLPGLQEALSEMWWQRLRRERTRFESVVIETTGMADPRPLVKLFEIVPLLRERYALKAVITTVSAVAGQSLLAAQAEARAQVDAAQVLVVTKTDCEVDDLPALIEGLHRRNPMARTLQSSRGSLGWHEVAAAATAPTQALAPATLQTPWAQDDAALPWTTARRMGPVAAASGSGHRVTTRFHALDHPVATTAWRAWFAPLLTPGVQRIKGIVELEDHTMATIQWSLGDAAPAFEPYTQSASPLGLTIISAGDSAA